MTVTIATRGAPTDATKAKAINAYATKREADAKAIAIKFAGAGIAANAAYYAGVADGFGYTFDTLEAIEALLGERVGEAELATYEKMTVVAEEKLLGLCETYGIA